MYLGGIRWLRRRGEQGRNSGKHVVVRRRRIWATTKSQGRDVSWAVWWSNGDTPSCLRWDDEV